MKFSVPFFSRFKGTPLYGFWTYNAMNVKLSKIKSCKDFKRRKTLTLLKWGKRNQNFFRYGNRKYKEKSLLYVFCNITY